MKIRPIFAWYDFWVGVFWDAKKRRFYVLPLPCIGIVLELAPAIRLREPAPREWQVGDSRYSPMGPLERARFLERIEKDGNCWRWTGATNGSGYGAFKRGPKKSPSVLAHRLSYVHATGEVLEPTLYTDHLCRNRWCVNPDHLEAVTNRENFLRGEHSRAKLFRSGRCARGHPFPPANANGRRQCSICNWERKKERVKADPEFAARLKQYNSERGKRLYARKKASMQ